MRHDLTEGAKSAATEGRPRLQDCKVNKQLHELHFETGF